jgi:hypothetical protein
MAKLGFASVLQGRSAEELGFNPAMVPNWITTNVPVSALNDQISSGQVVVELGLLIDGLADIGFRNTLGAARRDCQVRLPQNEVFHALTAAGSASDPALTQAPAPESPRPIAQAASSAFVIQPGMPGGQANRVESIQPHSGSAGGATEAPAAPHPLAAFASIPAVPAADSPPSSSAPSSPFVPKFGASLNPFAQSQPFQPDSPASPPVQTPVGNASPPLQPLAGAFQPFGSPPASSIPSSGATPISKPFDPFAGNRHGMASVSSAPEQSGFSSAQLLGQSSAGVPLPTEPEKSAFANVSTAPAAETAKFSGLFASSCPAREAPPVQPSFAPAMGQPAQELPPKPQSGESLFGKAFGMPQMSAAAPMGLQQPVPPDPAVSPRGLAPAAAPEKMAGVKHSFLGLAPMDTQTDQLLLRALLGTEEKLAAPRVVELLAAQPGLSACVCLHGSHVLSHADKAKTEAVEFQRQAPEIARQLRGLAPLIGIEEAETFTLNAGGRLLTFCFPGETIIGVLHDDEPSNGLRDKITLIARELARMLG